MTQAKKDILKLQQDVDRLTLVLEFEIDRGDKGEEELIKQEDRRFEEAVKCEGMYVCAQKVKKKKMRFISPEDIFELVRQKENPPHEKWSRQCELCYLI